VWLCVNLRNEHHKHTCLKEIRSHAPMVHPVLNSIVYIIWGNIYDHLIRGENRQGEYFMSSKSKKEEDCGHDLELLAISH
jgi:hypothetical protein